MSASSENTGLFGFKAKRLADCPRDTFEELKKNVTVVTYSGGKLRGDYKEKATPLHESVKKALAGLFSQGLSVEDTRLLPNENASDILVLTFDSVYNRGIVFICNVGIYDIRDGEYSWRAIQDLDLFFSFRPDGSVQIQTLK
jgi:hypothetical protein